MARLLLSTMHSSMNVTQTGFAALTVIFCAFTLFMCASHSRTWRKWTACYRPGNSEPVIQLHREGMILNAIEGGENQQVSGPIWQKNIPMGGKCQLPDFSGVIIYDSAGNIVTQNNHNSRLALPWN